MIMTCDCDLCVTPSHAMWQFVTVTCDIMLTSNSKSKKLNKNEKENKNQRENKKLLILLSLILTAILFTQCCQIN